MLVRIPTHIPFLEKKLWFHALHLEWLTETEKGLTSTKLFIWDEMERENESCAMV